MKYISEFREKNLVNRLSGRIAKVASKIKREIRLMEICGTHAMAILRYGIKELLPPWIKLISGPGCPVCVTPNQYIDEACTYAKEGFLVTTFGDMMRVPGSRSSLVQEKAKGGKIKVVYSTMEALEIAELHPQEKVVFLGVGFETTAPTVATSLILAKKKKITNYMILSGHKLIPPAMKALLEEGEVKIDGFLCPGHVSAITGSQVYDFIARKFGVPCVVAGFEPVDILQGIYLLLCQIAKSEAKVENEYDRVVKPEGNLKAKSLMEEVFRVEPSIWRGMGVIDKSGLEIRKEYSQHDVRARYPVKVTSSNNKKGCRCGEILKGVIEPPDCPLFGDVCNPSRPLGPCMVSIEGTCNIYYRFSSKVKI